MEVKVCLRDYNIHYYEIDYKRRLLATSLIDFFSDIATYQSEELGIGIDYLIGNSLAWVLFKWDVSINKYPVLGEKITIKTIPYAVKKFYAYRKFEVLNSEGEVIATANSVWFLVDFEKRKPVRVSSEMAQVYGAEDNPKEIFDFGKIEKLESYEFEKVYHVRYSDIDTNKHVNNTKYVWWAVESLPLDIITNYSLKTLRVSYEKETKYGANIKSLSSVFHEEDGTIRCLHKIEDEEGKGVTYIETKWEAN